MSSPASPVVPEPQRLTLTHWLILIIASIGFAFDIYELLMLPLILPPAMTEFGLVGDQRRIWLALMFWVPAMAGGLFGLLGGYLTDRLGRRRVLTWSILLYAFSAFLAGFSTSMPMLLFFRTTTFIGVCVEFVAAVAWLAELFPNPQQRERALGYTQAFSSIGGLLVGAAFLLAAFLALPDPSNPDLRYLPQIQIPEFLVPWLGQVEGGYAPWRYTLMSGLIPALPLIIIRPFLPESPIWLRKKESGTLKRPNIGELFSPALRRTTILTTLMVGLSYGAAFGAIQMMPQIVPAMPDVQEEVAHKTELAAEAGKKKLDPAQVADLKGKVRSRNAGQLQLAQEVGGLLGRFLLAFLIVRIVSRRSLLRIFQVPGLVAVPVVFIVLFLNNVEFFTVAGYKVTMAHLGIFFVGLFTVAQFSFWGNYLPVAYPTHLRGTGESMAHNVGGRMLGTSFAAVTALVSTFMPGEHSVAEVQFGIQVAYAAALVGFLVYLGGLILSFYLPEPKEETLHE